MLLLLSVSACDTGAFGPEVDAATTVELDADAVILYPGEAKMLTATVSGTSSDDPPPLEWISTNPGTVSVDASGMLTANALGSALVTAALFGGPADTAEVRVLERPTPPQSAMELIIGPQVPMGSSPWIWFDENQSLKAAEHHAAFMDALGSDETRLHYYDMGLALYRLGQRDPSHIHRAREVTAKWWKGMPDRVAWEPYRNVNAITPRGAGLGGLMLYALEGGGVEPLVFESGPEDDRTLRELTLWHWMEGYVRSHYKMWLGSRLNNDNLYFGVRDGGYMLLYTAWMAGAHPDARVRAEMQDMALTAARDYYARLQHEDGAWYWEDGSSIHEQPFMVGLLLEGMVAVHQLTGDAAVRDAILASVDHLWEFYRLDEMVPHTEKFSRDVAWRSVPYFVYPDGTISGETALDGGWDTNTIREGRQRNSLVVHAFGYAYHITGDPVYLERGDELFASTYGKGEGPGADAYYGLGDFRAKEYNQAYRSAGRYLGWRSMGAPSGS